MNTPDTITAWIDAYLASRRHAGFALTIEGESMLGDRISATSGQLGGPRGSGGRNIGFVGR